MSETDLNLAEPPVDEGVEDTEKPAPKTRGGNLRRGRPDNTVERDQKALDAIKTAAEMGLTRDELGEKIGGTSSEAYLSIYRLSRAKDENGVAPIAKVQHSGKPHWVAVEHLDAAREFAGRDAAERKARREAADAERAERKRQRQEAAQALTTGESTEAPVSPVEEPVEDVA